MDKLIVCVEHYKSDDLSKVITERLADDLKNRIKDNIGLSIEVNVSKKGSVPRSEGKAVRVIDER